GSASCADHGRPRQHPRQVRPAMNPCAQRLRRRIAWCVCALSAPAAASAQASPSQVSDTAVALRPIEVIVSILERLGPGVGSAASMQTTITGSALRVWQPRMLGDALDRHAGLSTYDDLGSPFKTTLVTRGFAASPVVGLPQGVSVFLDG